MDYEVVYRDGVVVETTGTPADPIPAILGIGKFKAYCYANLGGGSTGVTRFGEILLAMRASSDAGVAAVLDQYTSAITYDLANVTLFVGALVDAGIMTQQEAAAIIGNWPTV